MYLIITLKYISKIEMIKHKIIFENFNTLLSEISKTNGKQVLSI